MIYLDNSATTYPKPPEVVRAYRESITRFGFNPGRGGYRQSIRTAESVYRARTTLKDFFHAKDEASVIFTPGCTHALNTVIKGVLKPGDHAVISSLEHNAVVRPLHKMQVRGEITYSVAEVTPGDDESTIISFRNAINERTKLMICTHASNVFGYRLPTERLCALAHQYGIFFCLDAAQSAGVLPIDMENDGYDYLCLAGHKYLYGPMGVGALLLGGGSDPDSLIEGGTGSVSAEYGMPDFYPDRLEAGTLNIPGIIGLEAGVRFVSRYGIDRIYAQETQKLDRLISRMSAIPGVRLYQNGISSHHDAPVLSFSVNGHSSETVAKYLSESADIAVRGGLHCAPLAHSSLQTEDSGTVRISPSVFTTENDYAVFMNSLRKFR